MTHRRKPFRPALAPRVGFTGQPPAGARVAPDEQELKMVVAHNADVGKITLQFGTSIQWLSMTPDQARGLAAQMIQHAALAEAKPAAAALRAARSR